jgi:5-hydroxyisourate hydrolase-like protein (transthyretin family)
MMTYGGAVAQDSERTSPFTGAWHVSTPPTEIAIIVNGTSVTGSIWSREGAERPISGNVVGNSIGFQVDSPDEQRTITFRGTLREDTIAFTRSIRPISDGDSSGGNGIYDVNGPAALTATRNTSGAVSGKVLDKASGMAISKASVTLSRILAPGIPVTPGNDATLTVATTRTSPDGTFRFANVPAGTYELAVMMEHYLPHRYGQLVAGGSGRPVSVRSGEFFNAGSLSLTKRSVIAGTVLNTSGLSMTKTVVHAMSYVRTIGRWEDETTWAFEEVGAARFADASGNYRLEDLEPGDYYIVAHVTGDLSAIGLRPGCRVELLGFGQGMSEPICDRANNTQDDRGAAQKLYVPQFYPDGDELDKAILVHVPEGAEIRGIDITLRPTERALVNGLVVTSEAQPVRADVTLIPLGLGRRSLGMSLAPRPVASGTDGKFQFDGVPPGSYRIVADVSVGNDHILAAAKEIHVVRGSTQDVSLTLQRGVDIKGRLLFDAPLPPGLALSKLRMIARLPNHSLGSKQGWAMFKFERIGDDGSFTLRDMIPGEPYYIDIGGETRQGDFLTYLKEARYGADDVFANGLTTGNEKDDGRTLQVMAGLRRGRVQVTVTDQGKPQQGVRTALISLHSPGRSGLHVDAMSDLNGRVLFPDVIPGDYMVFAWNDVRQNSWFDPQFMAQFEGRGSAVHVEQAATSDVIVQIIKTDGGSK